MESPKEFKLETSPLNRISPKDETAQHLINLIRNEQLWILPPSRLRRPIMPVPLVAGATLFFGDTTISGDGEPPPPQANIQTQPDCSSLAQVLGPLSVFLRRRAHHSGVTPAFCSDDVD